MVSATKKTKAKGRPLGEEEPRSEYIRVSATPSAKLRAEKVKEKYGTPAAEIAWRGFLYQLEVMERGDEPNGDVIVVKYGIVAQCGPWKDAEETCRPLRVPSSLADLLGIKEGDYLIETTGESMVEAGIEEGTLLVMRPGLEPQNGDVCLIQATRSNGDVVGTVKRWSQSGSFLTPKNGMHHEICLPDDVVKMEAFAVKVAQISRGKT